jgi:hypothetical protein
MMHESNRAPGRLRLRSEQSMFEAWQDLSRYVAASRAAAIRRTLPLSASDPGERSG